MHAVGIRELKNRLSHYVRLVRAGEVILVTDHKDVVAELRPPGSAPDRSDVPSALMELVRRGKATLGLPREGHSLPDLPQLVPEGTAQRLLDEDRGER